MLTEAEFTDVKVKVTGAPKFEPILGAEIKDQFIEAHLSGPPKLFDLKKPTRLCTPVEKTRLPDGTPEPIKNGATHLMCYQAKPAKGQPPHQRRTGIHVNNQPRSDIHQHGKSLRIGIGSRGPGRIRLASFVESGPVWPRAVGHDQGRGVLRAVEEDSVGKLAVFFGGTPSF